MASTQNPPFATTRSRFCGPQLPDGLHTASQRALLVAALILTGCTIDEKGRHPDDTASEDTGRSGSEVEAGTPEDTAEDNSDPCDGIDNDEDGEIDEVGDGPGGFVDADGDGYGDPTTWVEGACLGGAIVSEGGDCDDANPQVHPGAVETCETGDQDCDGVAPESFSRWVDRDGDDWWTLVESCDPEEGLSPSEFFEEDRSFMDCDDNAPTTWPGAPELCGDGIVNDCSSYTEDPDCLTDAPCPSHWPLTDNTGQQVLFTDNDTALTWTTDAADTLWEATALPWTSRAYCGEDTPSGCRIDQDTETWQLACTSEGVVRLTLETERYNNYGGLESFDTDSARFMSPPVALPPDIAEGTTWSEVGVRHGRRGTGAWGVASAVAGFTTQHTVTACEPTTLVDVGEVEVCTIDSLDDDGRTWSWQVAEGVGPVGETGLDLVGLSGL